jgi:mitogen-activated protein kinase kinase kinase 13
LLVDLAAATAKTLVRLRRDELVRLCESREIEAEGTKPQLAEALIQWRDQQQMSAPSSTGTVRPPSTVRAPSRGRHKSSREGTKTPVLLRTHIHVHQPRTPPVSSPSKPKEGIKDGEDGELELDLAGLGLVDKEIPCDKLTKIEKIGSGGFKDVYVGKLKNRKVAIAEFRGQLTASRLLP